MKKEVGGQEKMTPRVLSGVGISFKIDTSPSFVKRDWRGATLFVLNAQDYYRRWGTSGYVPYFRMARDMAQTFSVWQ